MTDIGKPSSLVQYGKNYIHKMFYSTGPTVELKWFLNMESFGSFVAIENLKIEEKICILIEKHTLKI